jgi:hypothetical protein
VIKPEDWSGVNTLLWILRWPICLTVLLALSLVALPVCILVTRLDPVITVWRDMGSWLRWADRFEDF